MRKSTAYGIAVIAAGAITLYFCGLLAFERGVIVDATGGVGYRTPAEWIMLVTGPTLVFVGATWLLVARYGAVSRSKR